MSKQTKEIDVEAALADFYSRQRDVQVHRQVYFGGKKIDIVLLEGNTVSAIEVKLSDWKGALRQANLNKTGSDISYVAMWHEHASRATENINDFVKYNVGLIVVDGNDTPWVFYKPSKEQNTRLIDYSRELLMSNFGVAL